MIKEYLGDVYPNPMSASEIIDALRKSDFNDSDEQSFPNRVYSCLSEFVNEGKIICVSQDVYKLATRKVRVSLWTPDLTALQFTPVPRKCANKYLKMEKAGRIDLCDMPDSFFDRFGCSPAIYFDNDAKHILTVVDNNEEQKFKKYNYIDNGLMDLSECKTLDEAITKAHKYNEDDEDYAEGIIEMWQCFQKVLKRIDRSLYYNKWAGSIDTFLSLLKPFKDDSLVELFAKYIGLDELFAKYVKLEAQNFNDDGISYIQCGRIGKGKVYFTIDIPEGEPFDIDKLHFFNFGDFMDTTEINGAWERGNHARKVVCGDFHTFEYVDETICCLMFVEYDGVLYPLEDTEFLEGWKACNGLFAYADFGALEYDENAECEEVNEDDYDDEDEDEDEVHEIVTLEIGVDNYDDEDEDEDKDEDEDEDDYDDEDDSDDEDDNDEDSAEIEKMQIEAQNSMPKRRRIGSEDIFELVKKYLMASAPSPLSIFEIIDKLEEDGLPDTTSFKTRLYTLFGDWVQKGQLEKVERGLYKLPD